jgi:hypothetical protein
MAQEVCHTTSSSHNGSQLSTVSSYSLRSDERGSVKKQPPEVYPIIDLGDLRFELNAAQPSN